MIRKAQKEDCPELYDLIHEILVDMELPLLDPVGTGCPESRDGPGHAGGRLPVQLPEWPCL